jgi:hypothetical protein
MRKKRNTRASRTAKRRRRKRRTHNIRAVNISRRDDSITSWCARRGCSRGFFYHMQALGIAPRTIKIGKKISITEAADRDWEQQRQAATAADEARARSEKTEAATN